MMKKNTAIKKFSRKICTVLTSICIICSLCLWLPAGSIPANAETGTLNMSTVNTWDKMTSSYVVQGAEIGKTYTLSLYWYNNSNVNNYSRFLINYNYAGDENTGVELIYDNEPRNGAVLNRTIGLYSYTFQAQSTSIKLTFDLNDWVNGKQRIVWLGGIQIVETDVEGTPVEGGSELYCNSDTFKDWADEQGRLSGNVSPIDYTFFAVNNAMQSVTDLGISYISDVFAYNTYSYSVNVPYEVTELSINPSGNENYVSYTVSGNSNFEVGVPRDVVITVKDVKDGFTAYTITVTRQEEIKEGQTRILRLHEWNHEVGVYHTVNLEAGATYRFTALWKYAAGIDPSVYLTGSSVENGNMLLVSASQAQNGAIYNKATGRLTYEFTATGTDLTINVSMGTGSVEKDCYFAQPALFKIDENGDKIENSDIDCDSDFMTSWVKWNYGGEYRSVITDYIDFFVVYGDVNADGVFDIFDLIKLKKYVSGADETIEIEAIGKTSGETVDAIDLSLAQRGLLSGTGDVFKKKIS